MVDLEKELKITNILLKNDFAVLENVQQEVIYHYDKLLYKVINIGSIYLREEIYYKIENKSDEVIARILAVKSIGQNIKHYFDKKLTAKENNEILLRAAIIEKFYDLRTPRHGNGKYYIFVPIIEDLIYPLSQLKAEEECLEDEERYEKI